MSKNGLLLSAAVILALGAVAYFSWHPISAVSDIGSTTANFLKVGAGGQNNYALPPLFSKGKAVDKNNYEPVVLAPISSATPKLTSIPKPDSFTSPASGILRPALPITKVAPAPTKLAATAVRIPTLARKIQ